MTDTVADPAVTPTSAQAEVTVNAADAVRAQLAGRGIPETTEVVLFDLDPRAGVTVGRMDPARGTVADPYTDSGLTLDALDHVIADHLVRVGRVAAPTSREWHEEVLDLVRRGRERLRESDGTFLMGRDHIRLFRMARRDIAEAGAPLAARAEDLARAAVTGAAAPAVVITDRVGAWPGLRDAIARAVPVPVVDVEPAGHAIRPTAAGGHAADPDAADPDAAAVDVAVEPEPEAPAPATDHRAPATSSWDGTPSNDGVLASDQLRSEGADHPSDPSIFEAINQSPPPPATAFGALAPYGVAGQPVRDAPRSGRPASGGDVPSDRIRPAPGPSPHREPTSGVEPFGVWDANTDPAPGYSTAGPDRVGSPRFTDGPVTGPQAAGAGRQRRSGRRVLAVLALLCAVAVVGVATALAVAHDEATPTVAAPLPQRTAVTTEPEFADPAILAEARQPARRYTPPPPPETSTSVESAPRPRPRPRTPRPQRGVTIPNPIPGLPPIVLP